MKKPWYQKFITYSSFLLSALFFITAVLDIIDKSLTWVSRTIAFQGTVGVLLVLIMIYTVIKYRPIKWITDDRQVVYIKSLGVKPLIGAASIIIFLWLPVLLSPKNVDNFLPARMTIPEFCKANFENFGNSVYLTEIATLEQQYLSKTPTPQPSRLQAVRVTIPKLNLDAPVVEGLFWHNLKRGVAHYIGSADPGFKGNFVLIAHNDVYGELLRDLKELNVDDIIVVYNNNGEIFNYYVSNVNTSAEVDDSILSNTDDRRLTLVTCYPYQEDDLVIAVLAKLK